MQLPDDLAVTRLTRLTVPTLILAGLHDAPDVHATAGVLQALLPRAQRELLPNAGHFVYLEQPEQFNRRVLEFVERR